MKTLQIVTAAYRGTTEEQDDQILWLSRAMLAAGAELDVLLRGDAVNYAVRAQDASGLRFGEWQQTEPPRLADDVAALLEARATVFVAASDLDSRGIDTDSLVAGVTPVTRGDLARLLDRYERVWQW